MYINFEEGHNFRHDPRTVVTADVVREGIANTSHYLDGEAVILPSLNGLAKYLGVSKAALTERKDGIRSYFWFS